MNKKTVILTACGALLICVMIVLMIMFIGKEKDGDAPRIGFVMSGSVEETGWNGMHYAGVKNACEQLGTQLLVKENVKEFTGACDTAIKELVEEGAGMIILSSYGYAEEVQALVKEFPEIVFYVNSSEYHDVNMTSYFARMYQARYLAGIVAGMKTESNEIGYVAAMENNEVNRGINAFTLGVRSVNPKARVTVSWTGEWDNSEKETSAANALIEKAGVDVLTYHQNQPNVVRAAEAAGIYSIGYHEALEGCSEKYLTSVVCDWAPVYEQIIRGFLVGKANMDNNYWIGLEADAVGLTEFSTEVTPEIKEAVEKAKTELLTGKDVFSGTIIDNEGTIRCGEKENISDEILLEQFDWFVEGVGFDEN
ncbi:MAG: BMP family ABC transporter substrate-binding protein [Eubacterium sp.]|nr:BMP family ABC transporter substrate-binding protein [Eubacterium sp.]